MIGRAGVGVEHTSVAWIMADIYARRRHRPPAENVGTAASEAKNPFERPVLYTAPYPENTDTSVFCYVFGSNCQPDFFGSRCLEASAVMKTLKCGLSWDEARFLLEKKHGLFDVKQRKANLVGTFFHGLLWTEGLKDWRREAQPVPRDHIMTHRDRVIVVRRPLLRGLQPYVPPRFRPEMEQMDRETLTQEEKNKEERIIRFFDRMKTGTAFLEHMTEEEKIERIMGQMEDQSSVDALRDRLLQRHKRSRYGQFHPSDLELQPSLLQPPPPTYLCHRCGQRGHWRYLCPTLSGSRVVPVSVPKLPSGIPKTMLREAQSDEERRNAMMTDDGRLVVMKLYTSER